MCRTPATLPALLTQTRRSRCQLSRRQRETLQRLRCRISSPWRRWAAAGPLLRTQYRRGSIWVQSRSLSTRCAWRAGHVHASDLSDCPTKSTHTCMSAVQDGISANDGAAAPLCSGNETGIINATCFRRACVRPTDHPTGAGDAYTCTRGLDPRTSPLSAFGG